MIKESDNIVLRKDIPEHGLKKDDIGTVVLVHKHGKGYEVEFLTLDGETIAVVTLPASYIRSIGKREIARVRQVQTLDEIQ
jgi:hypothetical protein